MMKVFPKFGKHFLRILDGQAYSYASPSQVSAKDMEKYLHTQIKAQQRNILQNEREYNSDSEIGEEDFIFLVNNKLS